MSRSTLTARTDPLASTPTLSKIAWYFTCVTRTVAEFPTCVATRRASTRNSESATGTTTWTVPPPPTGIIWMTWPTEQILPRAQQSLTTWGGGKVGGVSRNPRSRRRRWRPRSRRRRPSLILLTSDIERNICETRNVLISEQLRAYSSSQRSVSKQWLVIKLNLNIYLFIHLCIRIIRLVLTTAKCGHFVNSFCYLYVKLCHFYSFIAQFF